MVVKEKGLLRAMKAAYKESGYKVAVEKKAGIENMMICGSGFVVVMKKEQVPRKVLGLIAEHLGTIPEPEEAFQVAKDLTQTEIFGVAMNRLLSIRSGEKQRYKTARTPLTLMGNTVWQREGDHKVVAVDPELECIMDDHGRKVTMIEDEMLMVDGNASRVYIECDPGRWHDEQGRMQYLSGEIWVSI